MTAKRVLHEREGGGVNRDVPTDDSPEAALRSKEAQLAGIIDSAMDAIITVDESQHILIFNSAAENLFGCSRADAIGQSLQKFIPHCDGQSHHGDLYGLRTTGEEFPMEASSSHLDTGGEKLCTLILRDVSSRKESELALQR